jgi:molybdopterin molybdotransferase
MAEFFNVLPPDEARQLLLRHIQPIRDEESIRTEDALGRVTHQAIRAPTPLPAFRRSTMDGYAVRAVDTHGAGESIPAILQVIGEVPMGREAEVTLGAGQAAIVHTGGMLPDVADAIVQVEHTQTIGASIAARFPFEIEVFRSVAPGQNVIQVGEDIDYNDQILPEGALIRPQDIGGLLAMGTTQVSVTRQPRIMILATGDEVVAPGSTPKPGQIRDINSYTIAGLSAKAGAVPHILGIVPDDLKALRLAAAEALSTGDMLVMSAGSSVSVRDMTVQVIGELGEPGVLLHGVATRPGKPTIVGAVGGKPVLGLPGNPVSAMVQFDMFGIPAIYRLQGMHTTPVRSRLWVRLGQNVPSESGREDYIPARLLDSEGGLVATPIFGKSNLINTLVQADGMIKIPLNIGGLLAGELVEVLLF